ncbi:MAG: type I methionyl aminopeptidase [Roseiflexaceae bacterium]
MTIETPQDMQGLLAIGRVVGQTLAYLRGQVQPGVTTQELDDMARDFLQQRGARSAPMLAVGFPRTICISINEEAAHGLPGDRRVAAGDLVKLDVSAELGGYFADAAITVAVAPVAPAHQRLCDCAAAALQAAVAAARARQPLNQIGRAAEQVALRQGYRIVRALTGHGVGRNLHEAPRTVPHYYDPQARLPLHEGLVLAIEPHVTSGDGRVVDGADGWTISTRDRKRVAAFEHTVVVTNGAPIVITAA